MKLYTKNGCVPCQRVKEYLSTCPQLEVEIINCSDKPEAVMEFSAFSKTFPTLVTDHGFVTNSDVIIGYLASLADSGKAAGAEPFEKPETSPQSEGPESVAEMGVNTEVVSKEETPSGTPLRTAPNARLARIAEPECEACQ